MPRDTDNNDILNGRKKAPLDKHMALLCLVEHLVATHLTSLPLMRLQLQYASELTPTSSGRKSHT